MKIIIIGAGVVGTHLARQLIAQQHDVTVIEKNETVVHQVKNRLDCLIINDEGNNGAVLENAGASDADFLVCVTRSDELNLLMCGMVKSADGKPTKIARVRNIRYSAPETYYNTFNVDFIINPQTVVVDAIIRSLETRAFSDVLEFENSQVQIRNLTVPASSSVCNKTLREVAALFERKFLIAIMYRDSQCIIPKGSDLIKADDIIYIAAERDAFNEIYKSFGLPPNVLRKIVIAGGGKIAELVAKHIIDPPAKTKKFLRSIASKFSTVNLKIIEKDREQAHQIAAEIPKSLVIHGDISDSELFDEEDLKSAELLIAVTGNDEINLLSATYGKSVGIKRAIVLVSKTNYPIIAHRLGIDATISIKNTVVNTVLQKIHRRHITSIHSLFDGMIEVLELDIAQESKVTGSKLADVKFPKQSLIISITRNKNSFIPRGDFVLRANDQVIFIAPKEYSDEISALITAS